MLLSFARTVRSGESDCMDEREGGQFSIFGAVEEMVCMDFGGKLWLTQSSANVGKAHVAVRGRTGQRKI